MQESPHEPQAGSTPPSRGVIMNTLEVRYGRAPKASNPTYLWEQSLHDSEEACGVARGEAKGVRKKTSICGKSVLYGACDRCSYTEHF